MADHTAASRRPARSIKRQLILVFALAIGVLPFLQGVALAHHAEITATINCSSMVSFTATAWTGQGATDAARTNTDIRIWYKVDNGPDIEVTHGAFNPGNSFSFSGQFQAPTSGTIVVYAQAVANWGNGVTSTESRNTGALNRPTDCDPGLKITKSGPGSVAQGGTVTYTLVVTNDGTGATPNDVTVHDDLDNAYSNVTASSTKGSCSPVGAGNVVDCNVGTLNAGQSATITITAKAPTGTCPTIENVASAHSGNLDDSSDTVSTNVTGCAPGLKITKSGPGTVTQGGTVTYTLVVTNDGTEVTPNDVTVHDDLDNAYSNVTASSTKGSCSPVGAGNVVDCNVGTLNAGQSATITITAKAPTGTCPTIENVASAHSGNLDDSSDTVSTNVTGCVPEVTFAKDGPATVGRGGTATYHISVHNGGSATSDPIVVTDVVDSRYTGVGASATQGTCTVNGNSVTCNIGTLAAGANATVTITATAPGATCPTIPNVAQVEQGEGDAQNTNSVSTTVLGCTPNITIEKAASETSVAVGEQFTYTLVVGNNGTATASAVQLTDSIPAGLTIVDPLPSGCTATGNDITCALGSLAPGASVSRTFTVEAGEGACPDVDNVGTVTVGTSSTDSNLVNVNVLCEEGNIAVRIVKDNDADNDGRYTDSEESKKEESDVPFELVITNTGENAWTFVSLVDTFAHTGLDLLEGQCDQLAGMTLLPGESVECRFTLQDYSPPEQTSIINTVKVCVEMEGDPTKTDCDKDPSKVRSAKVLGRTVTPTPTKTPPGGTAFTGADSRTVGFGLLAVAMLVLGTAVLFVGYRRRQSYDG